VILDTSTVVSILFKEDDALAHARVIADAEGVRISAATLVELTMVAEGRAGPQAGLELEAFLRRVEARVWPVTAHHAGIERDAWQRFGKGRHRAALDLGDCFSHALATTMDVPLLDNGEDFARTDMKAAF